MRLYLVRHGIAVESGTPGYEEDSQRPLTQKGREKIERIGSALKDLDVQPDQIVSSPYLRAVQTTEILAKTLRYQKQVVFTDALVPFGSPEDVINEISRRFMVNELMLVGHEPSLSSITGLLVAGDHGGSIRLKKGGVCRLEVEQLKPEPSATLEWLLTPKILSRPHDQ